MGQAAGLRRRVFRLRWVGGARPGWWLFEGKRLIGYAAVRRAHAIREAATFVREMSRARYRLGAGLVRVPRPLAQLVVHNKGSKTISFERTYGRDPRRSKG